MICRVSIALTISFVSASVFTNPIFAQTQTEEQQKSQKNEDYNQNRKKVSKTKTTQKKAPIVETTASNLEKSDDVKIPANVAPGSSAYDRLSYRFTVMGGRSFASTSFTVGYVLSDKWVISARYEFEEEFFCTLFCPSSRPKNGYTKQFGIFSDYFILDSFYASAGLIYESLQRNWGVVVYDLEPLSYQDSEQRVGYKLAVGNRWNFGRWILGVDWFGYTNTLKTLDRKFESSDSVYRSFPRDDGNFIVLYAGLSF